MAYLTLKSGDNIQDRRDFLKFSEVLAFASVSSLTGKYHNNEKEDFKGKFGKERKRKQKIENEEENELIFFRKRLCGNEFTKNK